MHLHQLLTPHFQLKQEKKYSTKPLRMILGDREAVKYIP